MVDSYKHRVLLIGSGLMTPPLVDYLASFGDTSITVASNMLAEAQKIAARHPKCMSAAYLDVMNVSKDRLTTFRKRPWRSSCPSIRL